MSPNVRYLLISEGVQVSPSPPTKKNYQGNQRLFLVRNAVVETEKKTTTIKAALQPASGSRHPKTFMGMLEITPKQKWLARAVDFNLIKATLWWRNQ